MNLKKDNLPEILPPKSDIVFKMLLGSEDDTDLLIDFLRVVLKKNIDSVVILNPALKPNYPSGKKSILDIRARLNNGENVDVEIQVEAVKEMRERISFYNDKMITDQLGEGKNYLEIKPAISIIIAGDVIIHETNKCHNVFLMLEKDEHFPFNGLKEIHILELSRFKNEKDPQVFDWLEFFVSKKKEEFMAIAERNPVMKKAFGRLQIISADEQARMQFDAEEKYRRDVWSRENAAEDRGMRKRAEEIARNMKDMGMDTNTIAKATGLFVDDILRLQ